MIYDEEIMKKYSLCQIQFYQEYVAKLDLMNTK